MNQSRLRALALLAIALLLTVGSGLLHGRLRQRWGHSSDALRAAEQMHALPATIGEWETISTFHLRDNEQAILQSYGHVGRVLRHKSSGAVVTLSLLVGPTGPTAVHTPEVCLRGNAYRLQGPRTALAVPGREDTAWTSTFVSTDVSARQVRAVYGWRFDGDWSAPEQPRFSFAGRPYLYKLNFSCAGDDAATQAQARDFLEAFVPAFEQLCVVR
jgi:hypothetical protein